jgi:CHAT domain-containing protein/tetratricopeptide (TPR) repeat protein
MLWRAAGDTDGQTRTLDAMGVVYSQNGQQQKAMECYGQALDLARSAGSRLLEAETLTDIGMSYWRRGQLDRALESSSQALPLTRAVGDRKWEALALNNIGLAHASLGHFQEALDYYNQTLPLARTVGDLRQQSVTLNNIGAIYKRWGEFQIALGYYLEALPLKRRLGNRGSEANTLHNIGAVCAELGDFRKALEYYDQAIVLSRGVGDLQGEAITLDSVGLVLARLGDANKAVECHKEALTLAKAVGDRRNEASTLSHLGSLYRLLREPNKALECYNQALSIIRDVGDRYLEAYSLSGIGSTYDLLLEPRKALEYHRRALQLSKDLGDQAGEIARLSEIARLERKLGNKREALSAMRNSLDILESTRAKLLSRELRASYLASKHDYYEFYIDLSMEMQRDEPSGGHDALALHTSERARARGMLELLGEMRADIRQGVDLGLLEVEQKLHRRIAAEAEKLTRLLSATHSEEQAVAAKKKVEGLLADYGEVEARIRSSSPRYAALTHPQPLSLKEIQEQVLDADTMLLEYCLGDERSYLWVVTRTSIASFVLPKRADIEAAARRVYDLLVSGGNTLQGELPALSQLVLGPVAGRLGRKRLLIVADGALQYIPFGALPEPVSRTARPTTRKYRPLVLEHEIVSLPSASVLAVLRAETGSRQPAPKTVAVLADAVYEITDPRVKFRTALQSTGEDGTAQAALGSDVERSVKEFGLGRFNRLPVSRDEAEEITSLTAREKCLRALDFDASRGTATSPEMAQYRIVHFAAHSLLSDQNPDLSGIVLSLVDPEGRQQNGFLRLHEIYNLKLNADLVVLSACQTALGKEIKGEGLVGLVRGFMYAGAPRVVASLWKVSDRATAELMKRFYQRMLIERQPAASALRSAQVSMLKEKQWEEPYYWAGFVLQGEWK